MAAGFKVWNSAGQLILDGTKRLMRYQGTVQTAAGTAGLLVNPGFTDAGPGGTWFVVIPLGGAGFVFPPHIDITGDTLSWDNTGMAVKIAYGIY